MDNNLFDKKTFNQIRTDLIHIQADLMTSKEKIDKLEHVVSFVGQKLPKIASMANPEVALNALNKYFKIASPPVTSQPKEKTLNYSKILTMLKNGQLPDDNLLSKMHAKGGRAFFDEDDFTTSQGDRERISDLFGNVLHKNRDNESVVKKILENPNIVAVLGPPGLEEQIAHAFRYDPEAFLPIFEDLDIPHFSTEDVLAAILTTLLDRILNVEPVVLRNILRKYQQAGFVKTVRILASAMEKQHPNYKEYWKPFVKTKTLKPQDVAVNTAPSQTSKQDIPSSEAMSRINNYFKAKGFSSKTLSSISGFVDTLDPEDQKEVADLAKNYLFSSAKKAVEIKSWDKYKGEVLSVANTLMKDYNVGRDEILSGLKKALSTK